MEIKEYYINTFLGVPKYSTAIVVRRQKGVSVQAVVQGDPDTKIATLPSIVREKAIKAMIKKYRYHRSLKYFKN